MTTYSIGDDIEVFAEKCRASGIIVLQPNKRYKIIFINDFMLSVKAEDGYDWVFLIEFSEAQFKKQDNIL